MARLARRSSSPNPSDKLAEVIGVEHTGRVRCRGDVIWSRSDSMCNFWSDLGVSCTRSLGAVFRARDIRDAEALPAAMSGLKLSATLCVLITRPSCPRV